MEASDLKKTSFSTSPQGQHGNNPEGRFGMGEKLRAPSMSYFKVVLGLGHTCKEEGKYQATAGGVGGLLRALITHVLLGWRHPSVFLLVCLLFLTLQVHTWAGGTAVFRSVEMPDSTSAFPLISLTSMKDLASKLTLHPK